ncbi:hypothetical protein CBL_03814 [Carabus blaptoides fortunei]
MMYRSESDIIAVSLVEREENEQVPLCTGPRAVGMSMYARPVGFTIKICWRLASNTPCRQRTREQKREICNGRSLSVCVCRKSRGLSEAAAVLHRDSVYLPVASRSTQTMVMAGVTRYIERW